MAKKLLITAVFAVLLLASCNGGKKAKDITTSTAETVEKAVDNIVKQVLTDKDGNKLELNFNNANNTVTLNLNNETAELAGQESASGFWYKNDLYELRGKGENVELKKDGKVVFVK